LADETGVANRGKDPRVVADTFAAPSDDIAAGIEIGGRGIILRAIDGGADANFIGFGSSINGITAAVNAPTAQRVLVVARPSDDKIAGIVVHGHGRIVLSADGGRVHLELGTYFAAAIIESLRVDAPSAAILPIAGPTDDECAVIGLESQVGIILVARGGRVHLKFARIPGIGVGVTCISSKDILLAACFGLPHDRHISPRIHARLRGDGGIAGGRVDLRFRALWIARRIEPTLEQVHLPSPF